ncbi:hypothetical protein BEN78_00075 [Xanthomonas citri pv. mangiferaeindicae]|nr:hypothetical protein BEN78_00075 [Xanthomonas citri pv. mangiferaeindicae]
MARHKRLRLFTGDYRLQISAHVVPGNSVACRSQACIARLYNGIEVGVPPIQFDRFGNRMHDERIGALTCLLGCFLDTRLQRTR